MRDDDPVHADQRMLRILNGSGDPARISPGEWRLGADDHELLTEDDAPRRSDAGFDAGLFDAGFDDRPPGPRFGIGPRAAIAAGVVALLGLVLCAWLALRPATQGEIVPARDSPSSVIAPGATFDPGASAPPSAPASAQAGPSGGASISVYVVGQVRDPGVVTIPAGARVVDAVEAAGGATGRADLAALNLARHVADGEQIVVPRPGEAVAQPAAPAGTSAAPASGSGQAGAGGAGLVNLNTATEAQLDELPGVGPVIAGRIVAWREQNGKFASVGQLGEVDGIGDATLTKLTPLVTV